MLVASCGYPKTLEQDLDLIVHPSLTSLSLLSHQTSNPHHLVLNHFAPIWDWRLDWNGKPHTRTLIHSHSSRALRSTVFYC